MAPSEWLHSRLLASWVLVFSGEQPATLSFPAGASSPQRAPKHARHFPRWNIALVNLLGEMEGDNLARHISKQENYARARKGNR